MNTLSACLMQTACLVMCRIAAESLLKTTKDLQTPGRIASFFHGAFCSVFLLYSWEQAIATTGLFFVCDVFLASVYKKPLPWMMSMHHCVAAILCLYSYVEKSYELTHIGAWITRALICMETTNPIFHIVLVARNENLWIWNVNWIRALLKGLLLFQFVTIRICMLGYALAFPISSILQFSSMQTLMYASSLCMWVMQWVWLQKLVAGSKDTPVNSFSKVETKPFHEATHSTHCEEQ